MDKNQVLFKGKWTPVIRKSPFKLSKTLVATHCWIHSRFPFYDAEIEFFSQFIQNLLTGLLLKKSLWKLLPYIETNPKKKKSPPWKKHTNNKLPFEQSHYSNKIHWKNSKYSNELIKLWGKTQISHTFIDNKHFDKNVIMYFKTTIELFLTIFIPIHI